jgi:hypothetical protein
MTDKEKLLQEAQALIQQMTPEQIAEALRAALQSR